VDNRAIRELASEFPAVHFLCMSKDSFHPELQDAISRHIYACLSKPVDPEELFYWLKCIQEDDKGI
jgi:DNA-binding NarL/FixJ family response regulator